MYSAQITLLAALQALPGQTSPPPQHPNTPTSYTQDTQNKHSPVNWQDFANYSVITQAQARYEYLSQRKEQILFYISKLHEGARQNNSEL